MSSKRTDNRSGRPFDGEIDDDSLVTTMRVGSPDDPSDADDEHLLATIEDGSEHDRPRPVSPAVRWITDNADTVPVAPVHASTSRPPVHASASRPPEPAPRGDALLNLGRENNEEDEDEDDAYIEALIGSVLLDRYRVMRLIGQGGMGSVFLGEHMTIRKQVAIKVLAPDLAARDVHVKRFLREAQATSMIRHRNVVDITDFGYIEDMRLPFFVMEYLDGEDLLQTLMREGQLGWERARALFVQVCAAIEAAHERGVIHRDIKAENCFLVTDDDGAELVKVLDFGVAKLALQDDVKPLTAHGVLLGTVEYIAPERVLSGTANRRSDIYSLGVLLYHMLTGRTPFSAPDATEVAMAHVHKQPAPPSQVAPHAEIYPRVEAAILKAMDKSPHNRFETAAELAEALAHDRTELLPSLPMPDAMPAPAPRRRRGRAIALVCIAIVALAAGGFMVWRVGQSRSPDATVDAERLRSFGPLPALTSSPNSQLTAEQIALGERLFHDPRLSPGGDVACATCHDLARYGADGALATIGHAGQALPRNTPSVYNAAGQPSLTWDGRFSTMEALTSTLIAPDRKSVDVERRIAALAQVPDYRDRFGAAFPGQRAPITRASVGAALAAFLRTLVTPAPWDRFLRGHDAALTDEQKRGFNLFVDVGCASCHAGPLVGGTMHRRIGLRKAWPNIVDLGRYPITDKPDDRMSFKVPSLRNIVETSPYFHDGSVASLDEAVTLMAWHQLGERLSDAQVAAIVAWLRALTGEPPAGAAEPPVLP